MDAAVHQRVTFSKTSHSRSHLSAVRDEYSIRVRPEIPPHDDIDDAESDSSLPHDVESTSFSSVTTPDLMSRPPPPPPFDSKHYRISLKSPPPPPPPGYRGHKSIPPPPGLHPHLPPPPPPPPPPAIIEDASSNSQRLFHSEEHSSQPTSPYSNRTPRLSHRTNEPPAPPPVSNHDTPRPKGRMLHGPPPPLPPQPSLPPPHFVREKATPSRSSTPRSHEIRTNLNASGTPTSKRRAGHSKRRRDARMLQTDDSYFQDDYQLTLDPSALSAMQRTSNQSSVSEYSSEEDPIVYRNAREFPPRLPAAPVIGNLFPDSKAAITNRITSWVAQRERTSSPQRAQDAEAASSTTSEEVISGQDSNSAGSDTSSEGEVELLWTQLKEKRARLNEIKAQMAIKRKQLRDLRRKKDDADNAFMGVIRPILVNQRGILHTPLNLLDRRLAEMQSLRNEYHFLESNYEGLEVMLDEEEEMLNNFETRFFSLLAAGRMRPERHQSYEIPVDEEAEYLDSMPLDLRGISPEGPPEQLHPLYTELVSTLGDLENAREEYDDLLFIKEEYQFDMEMKKSTGKRLDDDEAEFFAEFPGEQARMLGNVQRLTETVARLKKECEIKGAMRKYLSPRMAYLLYPGEPYEDIELGDQDDILANGPNLAHEKFSVLLSQPEHVLADEGPYTSEDALRLATKLPIDDPDRRHKIQLASKEFTIDRLIIDHENGGKADFVNRWLLQQLRTSPMNAELLHSTFISSQALKIRDFGRWQSDVLHHWWRDTKMASANGSDAAGASRESDFASRVGTPQQSRAMSDQRKTYHLHDHDFFTGSDAPEMKKDVVFPHSYPPVLTFPHDHS